MTRRVLIFGATGTVGSGAVLECLDHPEIAEVICVVRRATGREHPKLREVLHDDFEDFTAIAHEFDGVDACFWAIGSPSASNTEEDYLRIELGFVSAAARAIYAQSPQCRFVFVSGAGADESEGSAQLWARVKGKAENTVMTTGFNQTVIFRPGVIAPRRGITHSVRHYGWVAKLAPLMRPFGMATSTEEIGRAFVAIALGRLTGGAGDARLDSTMINALAKQVPDGARK